MQAHLLHSLFQHVPDSAGLGCAMLASHACFLHVVRFWCFTLKWCPLLLSQAEALSEDDEEDFDLEDGEGQADEDIFDDDEDYDLSDDDEDFLEEIES